MRDFFALALLGATATATVLDTVKVMDGETPVMNVNANTYAKLANEGAIKRLTLVVDLSVELQGDLVINDATALPSAWMCF